MAAASPGAAGAPIQLQPGGCDQCGSTSLQAIGGGKFQCAYCGAFTLAREPPALEIRDGVHDDPNKPPPSAVNEVSAIEVLGLSAQGEVAAPPVEKIRSALDKNGPKGFFQPSPLSRFVNVTEATGHAPLRIQYVVFWEKRSYVEVTRPYRGERPNTSALPPIWSTALQPPQGVSTRRVPIAAQERVGTCPTCAGRGWVSCAPCGGDGRDSCLLCFGRGYHMLTELRKGRSYQSRRSCFACDGSGYKVCSHCGGRGRVTCATCQGQRRVLFTHERVEDFQTPTAMHAISVGRDWSSHRWMQGAQGELLFDRVVPGMMDLTESDGPIAQLADQVLRQHNGSLAQGHSYWARLMVTRVPVVEVAYRVGSKPGTLYVYGKDDRVAMPGKKPGGCMGCMLWTLGAFAFAAGGLVALLALYSGS